MQALFTLFLKLLKFIKSFSPIFISNDISKLISNIKGSKIKSYNSNSIESKSIIDIIFFFEKHNVIFKKLIKNLSK